MIIQEFKDFKLFCVFCNQKSTEFKNYNFALFYISFLVRFKLRGIGQISHRSGVCCWIGRGNGATNVRTTGASGIQKEDHKGHEEDNKQKTKPISNKAKKMKITIEYGPKFC